MASGCSCIAYHFPLARACRHCATRHRRCAIPMFCRLLVNVQAIQEGLFISKMVFIIGWHKLGQHTITDTYDGIIT